MPNLLETHNWPEDLQQLSQEQLLELADEVREKIIDSVAQTGGHLSSSLGTVELTIALLRVFQSPTNKFVWDVSHQTYAHKILTGRLDRITTLRQTDGLSGFLNIFESPHDSFGAGHAGTAGSAALGLTLARDHFKSDHKVIAIVGDGAMTSGMQFEALNHAGDMQRDLIIILNDNSWSISKNVGAMSDYLNRILTGQFYNRAKNDLERLIGNIPGLGQNMVKMLHNAEEHMKGLLVPGTLFEEMGFRYFGPLDGHDLNHMIATLESLKHLRGPILLHCITQKGKGYQPAEDAPTKWHGATPFDKLEGRFYPKSTNIAYTEVFQRTLMQAAETQDDLHAITAAMATGTGLTDFADKYPDRFVDVGIAEEHAVTLAAGMARGGVKPVVAIYSTFLQRAFDQIIHDVALQKLPVIFAVDRASLVGADGPTHHGVFDMAYLRMIPNLTVLVPSNEAELSGMLKTAFNHDGPIAVRYPRIPVTGEYPEWLETPAIPIGQAEVVQEGEDMAILVIGTIRDEVQKSLDGLRNHGINPWVVNMRSLKPLDCDILRRLAGKVRAIVTVEEHNLPGGFGSAVMETWQSLQLEPVSFLCLGIPDQFTPHGSRSILLQRLGLDPESICQRIVDLGSQLNIPQTEQPSAKMHNKIA